MKPGDAVVLHLSDGITLPGEVEAIVHWAGILVRCEDGQRFLEVVFNRSAVSWTRMVALRTGIGPIPNEALKGLIARIAFQVDRTDVKDIPEAAELLGPEVDLKRV